MSPFQGEEASSILVTRSEKKDDSQESFFFSEIGKAVKASLSSIIELNNAHEQSEEHYAQLYEEAQ